MILDVGKKYKKFYFEVTYSDMKWRKRLIFNTKNINYYLKIFAKTVSKNDHIFSRH